MPPLAFLWLQAVRLEPHPSGGGGMEDILACFPGCVQICVSSSLLDIQ